MLKLLPWTPAQTPSNYNYYRQSFSLTPNDEYTLQLWSSISNYSFKKTKTNKFHNYRPQNETLGWQSCREKIKIWQSYYSRSISRELQHSVLSSQNSFGGKEQNQPLGGITVSFWRMGAETLTSGSPVPSVAPGTMVTGGQQTLAEWMDDILSKGSVLLPPLMKPSQASWRDDL